MLGEGRKLPELGRLRRAHNEEQDHAAYPITNTPNPSPQNLHRPGKPPDPPDDIDVLAAALVGLVERVVGDDANPRRIAVGNVLEPFGDNAHAVVQHEDAGRGGGA